MHGWGERGFRHWFSFHHVDYRYWTRVVRLSGKAYWAFATEPFLCRLPFLFPFSFFSPTLPLSLVLGGEPGASRSVLDNTQQCIFPASFSKSIYMCFECTPHVCGCQRRREQNIWIPWNWSYKWLWAARHGCSELNLNSLEEQKAFLTINHLFSPTFHFLTRGFLWHLNT